MAAEDLWCYMNEKTNPQKHKTRQMAGFSDYPSSSLLRQGLNCINCINF